MKNKKKTIKICNTIAVILVLSFLLQLLRDWYVYNTTLNSAPFRLWIMVDAVLYLVPAAVVFLIGCVVRHRKDRKEN